MVTDCSTIFSFPLKTDAEGKPLPNTCGIGASLVKDKTTANRLFVTQIVENGPAYREGQLRAGDEILNIEIGNKPLIDILPLTIQEVILQLKGEKGTIVRLKIRKPSGVIKTIAVKRGPVW